MSVETRFLARIFSILKVDAQVLALADVTNIRPTFDMSQPTPGSGMIVFGFLSFSFNPQQKKGRGALKVTCSHPDSADKARQLFDRFTALCTAVTLNADDVGVAFFREDENSEGDGPQAGNQYNVPSGWKVLLTEVG